MDPIWEKLHSSRSWGKYPAESLIRKVMRNYSLISNKEEISILEIGCGAGANLSFFMEEGFNVTGIDGSESAIKNAKKFLTKKFKEKKHKLKLEVIKFEDYLFKKDSFDLVVDYFAIYANKMKVIKSIYSKVHKVLKPNGYFYGRVWGDLCEGANTGYIFEPGTSLNPSKGPCKDMGTSHFFNEKEIYKIFSNWSEVEVTKIVTTKTNLPNQIEEYEIWAKP
tara:strand:- start:20 stop:685 length:666 start_codon:yes stop_codon:yes gene_type:complete